MTRPPSIDGIAASHLQLAPGAAPRLLDALCERFPGVTAEVWLGRFARGRVLGEGGRALDPDAPVRTGLDIYYYRELEHEPPIPVRETVLHVDAHLIVVDKPHFLPVVPAGRFVRETLLARLACAFPDDDLAPLHRIDRLTAGLVLFSRNTEARDRYQTLFRERRIVKHYEAIAPALRSLSFPYVHRSRLEPGAPFFRMQECSGTSNSETRIDIIDRHPDEWAYRLEPVTGRKHQLRVHMASLGAPIRHDPLYPELAPAAADDFERPLKLLARGLAFADPLDGRERVFESRLSL
ncbi:pseudouridine synthase [Cognatilysobacter bugurensis]|uniref:Pseudouridine synthase n=1 Tax=Cognatilysobacter bugurensis TaxID=543356 RepID=A0A918W6N9_9GAMM|nr:pseudouridine synthase [Lysobacter bugurensis]GHA70377.1 pseudouridine synthase [Lysobacter bugurensis]